MENFDDLLNGSAKAHGHLCPGQVIGVRMAMEGCRLIGLDNPGELCQLKKLLVYVEIDRCATDAISYVTNVSLGHRSLKFLDHGIMAATFLNLETRNAYRLVSTETSRELAGQYAPEILHRPLRQIEAYKRMPIEELFTIQAVRVQLDIWNMPGPTRSKAVCQQCGQLVRDKKEVVKQGRILCRPCAGDCHYQPVEFGSLPCFSANIFGINASGKQG